MSITLNTSSEIAWWKEPTKDQWLAWIAAWLGWTLDAFDFTMFLLIMVPISQEFHVPLTEVAFVLSVTLWLRLVGAVGSGWLADRIGRKIRGAPLAMPDQVMRACAGALRAARRMERETDASFANWT